MRPLSQPKFWTHCHASLRRTLFRLKDSFAEICFERSASGRGKSQFTIFTTSLTLPRRAKCGTIKTIRHTGFMIFSPDFSTSSTTREERHLRTVCVLSLLVGALYVFLVRAGLPYDEAAHWNIVRHYARRDFLPVMGESGVSYEAYQAPAFYFFGGIFTFITRLGGAQFAFYALRFASLLLILPTIWLCYTIARHVLGRHGDALLVALFVGLNPCLLAIYASVQNDSAAITLSLFIMWLSMRWIGDTETSSTRCALWLGALTGMAILFKLTSAFAFFAVLIYFAIERRNARQWLRFFIVYTAIVLAICGWWFARNVNLYGDFSGSASMKKFFPEGAGTPLDFTQIGSWKSLAQNLVTYWWTPTEYFRNLVELPRIAKLIITIATLLGALGAAWSLASLMRTGQSASRENANRAMKYQIRSGESSRRAAVCVAIFYAVCLAIYVRTIATQWFFPARMTLVVLVAPALLIVGGSLILLRRLGMFHRVLEVCATRVYGAVLVVFLLSLHVVVLHGATQLRPMPFDMKFATKTLRR